MTSHHRLSRPTLLALGGLLAAGSCVDTGQRDVLGTASFISSRAAPSQDYAPVDMARAGQVSQYPVTPVAGSTGTLPSAAGRAATVGSAGAGVPPMAAAGTGARAGGPSRAQAGTSASNAGAPAAGAGPSGGGKAETAPATQMGTLALDFTTVNQSGRYAPQNVGAVWIESSTGTFIKTIERWGNIRSNHLTRWIAASGGWGSVFGGGGNTTDKMDAISRATLRSHGAHQLTWDMVDPMGKVVPDGAYNVLIEVTEDNNRPGAVGTIPFVKGAAPQQVAPADMPPYSKLTLSYQP